LNPLWATNAVDRLFLFLVKAANSGDPRFNAYCDAFVTNEHLMNAAIGSPLIEKTTGEDTVLSYINERLAPAFQEKYPGYRAGRAKEDFLAAVALAASGDPEYLEKREVLINPQSQNLLLDDEDVTIQLKERSLTELLKELDRNYWCRRSQKIIPQIIDESGDPLELWGEIREAYQQNLLLLQPYERQVLSDRLASAYSEKYKYCIKAANTPVYRDAHQINSFHWENTFDGSLRRQFHNFTSDVKEAYVAMAIISENTLGLVTPIQLGLSHQFLVAQVESMRPEHATLIEQPQIVRAQSEIREIADKFRKMDWAGAIIQERPAPGAQP